MWYTVLVYHMYFYVEYVCVCVPIFTSMCACRHMQVHVLEGVGMGRSEDDLNCGSRLIVCFWQSLCVVCGYTDYVRPCLNDIYIPCFWLTFYWRTTEITYNQCSIIASYISVQGIWSWIPTLVWQILHP